MTRTAFFVCALICSVLVVVSIMVPVWVYAIVQPSDPVVGALEWTGVLFTIVFGAPACYCWYNWNEFKED